MRVKISDPFFHDSGRITGDNIECLDLAGYYGPSAYYRSTTDIFHDYGISTNPDIILNFNPSDPDEPQDALDSEGDFDDLSDLFAEIESDDDDTWFTPTKVEKIKRVHDYLDGLEAVGKVLSLATVVRVAEDLNKGREFDAFQLNGDPSDMISFAECAAIDIDPEEEDE